MTTYKRPRGFLKSIGLGKASKFVDAEIYRLVDHLPQYEDEYSDEDGLMSVYDEIHLDYKSESKEQACTASFLKEVSKAIMAKRPATALHMLDSGSLYIPTADLQKITSDAVKAFESRGIYGFYRTSAVISYLRRVFKRYEDVPWPTDRLEPLYLTALVHEGVEELRLEGDCQHQQVAKEFDYLIRCLREAEPNMVDFFRALADAPQEAVEAGECKPEKAIRRRALVNRFFGIVMERGTSVDLLGDNPLCLKNMLKLIEDGPKRLEPPQSLATEYDNREFREVLALKQLSVIHTRGYLQGRTGSDMVANLSSFTSIVDDAKSLMQAFRAVRPELELRKRGFAHLMAAVIYAGIRKELPQTELDDLITEMSAFASLEKAYEGGQQKLRHAITDYVIRKVPEQAGFLSYQDRGQKFISELGV